jgi:flagellar motor switch protein FliN/FliY
MAEEEKKEEEMSQEELAKQWEEALAQQQEAKEDKEEKEEERAPQPARPSGEDLSKLLERIMDIPLNVEVVVGSAVIQIKELLNMGPGSVFELDRETTEPVDIKVNGKLIAKGELVVVGEKFGVRITEIYTEERKSVFRDTLEETLKK